MIKYILKRLLVVIPVFIVLTLAVYVLSNMCPGNPVDVIAAALEGGISQEGYDALLRAYDLDKPVMYRYGKWLLGVVQGDLGTSMRTKQSVAGMIGERITASLSLMGTGMIVAIIVSVSLGVAAAWKPYSFWDNASTFIAFMGSALPSFFLGLCMLFIFAVKLKWLPTYGMYTANAAHTFSDLVLHLVMPAFLVALQNMGNIVKQTRGALLEVLNEEYIKTARAKGLGEKIVLIKHGLRNALIPVVTVINLLIPYVIGGSVVIEKIFGWPGIGSLLMISIESRDYNVIMGVSVMVCVIVLACNITLDLLYGVIDPRVSHEN